MTPPDELLEFLDMCVSVTLNVSDTFAYASADAERVWMDGENNNEALVEVWRKFGYGGIVAYVEKVRGALPLDHPQVRTENYVKAKEFLADWDYDDD